MKIVGKKFYAHNDADSAAEFPEQVKASILDALSILGEIKNRLTKNFCDRIPDVLAYELTPKGHNLSIVWCEDWDGTPEPVLVKSASFHVEDGEVQLTHLANYANNRPIYHGKHLFVAPTYQGFDIEAAKARYEAQKALSPNPLRMGREDWWNEWCQQNNF